MCSHITPMKINLHLECICRFLNGDSNNVPIPRESHQSRINIDHSDSITERTTIREDRQQLLFPQNNVTTEDMEPSRFLTSELSSLSSNSSSVYHAQVSVPSKQNSQLISVSHCYMLIHYKGNGRFG
jgi:hypothetical protein